MDELATSALFAIELVVFVGSCIGAAILYTVLKSKLERLGICLFKGVLGKILGSLIVVIVFSLIFAGAIHPWFITYPAMFGTMPATREADGTIRELPFGTISSITRINEVVRMREGQIITCNARPAIYFNGGTLPVQLISPWPWSVSFKRVDGYISYAKYWKTDELCAEAMTIVLREVQRQFASSDASLTESDAATYYKKEGKSSHTSTRPCAPSSQRKKGSSFRESSHNHFIGSFHAIGAPAVIHTVGAHFFTRMLSLPIFIGLSP